MSVSALEIIRGGKIAGICLEAQLPKIMGGVGGKAPEVGVILLREDRLLSFRIRSSDRKGLNFIFLNDKLAFDSKWDKAIFRGVASQQHRKRFMAAFFGNPLVDGGDTGKGSDRPKEWHAPLITLYDHLKYKFVISLEGNDVASNLKWVMSSNSIAIMPRPKYESWFMEGPLQGGVHYIEIKDDYSDLEEKIRYYSTHPEEAKAIIRNAQAFVDQFRDKEREELISLLVLEKYFRHTRQN